MTNNLKDRFKEFIKRKKIGLSEETINKMFDSSVGLPIHNLVNIQETYYIK